MRKGIALWLVLALLALGLAGCKATEKQKTFKIGIAAKNFSDPFTAWQARTIADKAKSDYTAFEVTMIDCEGKIEKEISAVENFIAQKVDLIIWQVSDGKAGTDVATRAHKAGIPVISMSNIISDEFSYAIRSDQVREGEIIGEYLFDKLENGAEVFICRAPDGSVYGNNRTLGVKKALLDKKPDIKLVEEKPADWARDKAVTLMEDWLTAYAKIDAVICHNDAMALGCVEAIKAAGRMDEIIVVGIDGLPEACWSVSKGEMRGTVIQDAVTQADKALALANDILVNEAAPKDRVIVVDGEMVAKDKGNLDKWIGIHKQSGNWQYE